MCRGQRSCASRTIHSWCLPSLESWWAKQKAISLGWEREEIMTKGLTTYSVCNYVREMSPPKRWRDVRKMKVGIVLEPDFPQIQPRFGCIVGSY
jgi:hypothetical protein